MGSEVVDVETVASTMKVVLFWAVGILIPIIGLQAEEVIDDMVILEAPSRQSRQYVTPVTPNYPFATLTGLAFRGTTMPSMNQPCVTLEGKMGLCMGVNECYPERKSSILAGKILGFLARSILVLQKQ